VSMLSQRDTQQQEVPAYHQQLLQALQVAGNVTWQDDHDELLRRIRWTLRCLHSMMHLESLQWPNLGLGGGGHSLHMELQEQQEGQLLLPLLLLVVIECVLLQPLWLADGCILLKIPSLLCWLRITPRAAQYAGGLLKEVLPLLLERVLPVARQVQQTYWSHQKPPVLVHQAALAVVRLAEIGEQLVP